MDYSNYDKRVKTYMSKLEKTLKSTHGEITQDTEVNLDLLAANLNIYFKIVDEISEKGVMVSGRDKLMVKQPLLASLNSQNQTIIKLINTLGLTPMAKYKMKNLVSEEEDFEESLIS